MSDPESEYNAVVGTVIRKSMKDGTVDKALGALLDGAAMLTVFTLVGVRSEDAKRMLHAAVECYMDLVEAHMKAFGQVLDEAISHEAAREVIQRAAQRSAL